MRPLAIDLFCGLGGWTDGLIAEGYDVIGFDIEEHKYGDEKYPAQLVLQDVLTIHGSQFKDAALIVASPPCQEYSYMAMPWSKAKEIRRQYLSGERDQANLTALFDACFRIQREAIEASRHFIPLVVENVRGAQEWIGRSRWNFGSFHLWGDVPALMPMTARAQTKNQGGSWFNISHGQANENPHNPVNNHHLKARGYDWGRFLKTGEVSPHWALHAGQHTSGLGEEGIKCGGNWFGEYASGQGSRNHGSNSKARKAASARIAKIPFVLSQYIARTYYPHSHELSPAAAVIPKR